MPTYPRDRFSYSSPFTRPALKLPGKGRMIVWSVVNIEEWEITRPMARQLSIAPQGQSTIPDMPNWTWYEYGMRVGFWRLMEALKKAKVTPTMSLNAKVCETYPEATGAARDFDMYSTVLDQVYGGVDAEKPQSDSAITTTADVVVLYNGQPIVTPYHSTCGGSTAAVTEVWYNQSDEPYLRPVSDKIPGSDKFYCDPSPRFAWKQNYDAESLKAVMEKYLATYTNAPKSGLGRITDIREQGRTKSGRVAALAVQTESGTYTLRGNDIRFVLRDPKGAILNSTYFNFEQAKSNGGVSALDIDGRGYGHGIGMCQWGAIGRARAGQDFRTILETYYPGTTIGRIAG